MQDFVAELLKHVNLSQLGGVGLFLVAAVVLFWDRISGGMPKLNLFGTSRPRIAVMEKLDDAFSYFEEEGCEEGMAAIKVALSHVYHDHPETHDSESAE